MRIVYYLKIIKRLLPVLLVISLGGSCKKYLDQKYNEKQQVPDRVEDLQAILDQYGLMNARQDGLRVISADEYYLLSTTWASLGNDDRLNYIWDKNATYKPDWIGPYQVVFQANTVLDNLAGIKIDDGNKSDYNNVKGQALFFRAFLFHHLAQLYCKPFLATSTADPGIPLRTTADIEAPSKRATVKETYERILADLKEAVQILPLHAPALTYGITRPTKPAAYGMLARTYLSMRDYVNAGLYADSCLQLFNRLLDFNSLNVSSLTPITASNSSEVIFYTWANLTIASVAQIDTLLYNSYVANDLRKSIYFLSNPKGYLFKGNYAGELGANMFSGIATDEMYLTRAECLARAGNKDAAMADLDTLLQRRWVIGTFIPYTATDNADALNKVLSERKKELLFRGLRWMDLRRFNAEGANISLTRNLNGTIYTLPPNDLRATMLIPFDVINLSGMPQNPR